MKRTIKLSLIILLITICFAGSVYAAPSCNVSIKAPKLEVGKNEEFTVDVNLSDIQSELGIVALEGILEYDKESLTLVKMEGQNSWSTPVKNLSYNENNGKLVIDKNGLAKEDETILKLTFKANEASKKDLEVSLKNISISDGTVPGKLSNASIKLTVKDGIEDPGSTKPSDPTSPNPDTNTIPNTNDNANTSTNTTNIVSNTNKTQNTETTKNSINNNKVVSGKLPKTGDNNAFLIIGIAVVITIGVISCIKMKKVNKD